jgi:hypothetical protein
MLGSKAIASFLASTRAVFAAEPALWGVLTLGLTAGAVVGIPVEEKLYDYVWNDSYMCDDCHVHDYANEAYWASIHGGVTTCHDCHLVPISHYPRNLFVTAFTPPQGPEDIHPPQVASVVCTRCHSAEGQDEPLTGPMSEAVRQHTVKIDDSELHRVHLGSKDRLPSTWRGGTELPEGHAGTGPLVAPFVRPSWDTGVMQCADCHGAGPNRAHQFTATRENCVACHGDLHVDTGRFVDLDCRQCHLSGFLAGTRSSSEKTGGNQ